MKNFILTILVTTSLSSYAQWTTNGSNINSTNTGNVGIGTTAPTYKFHVVGFENNFKGRFQGADGYIDIGPANSGWAHIYTDRPAFIFNQPVYTFGTFSSYNADLVLQTTGNSRLTINQTSGNVGIGTTNPDSKLEVVGPATGGGATIRASGGGDVLMNSGGSLFFDGNYSYASGNYIRPIASNTQAFYTSGTERLRITPTGLIGIGTTSPSTRLSFGTSIQSRMLSLYDDPNDWYGVGVQSYQMRLQVGTANARFSFYAGDNTELMTIKGSGNVGIGTNTPSQSLNVYRANSQTQFLIGNSNTASGGYTSLAMGTSADTNGYSFIQSTKSSGSAFGDIVMNQNGGNVGIGTTSPTQKLTVNGTIYGKEVKVDLNVPGPDYVFEQDYKLPSLEEIKSYIDQHKHLPEVPSAKEMEQNGINVSEMNMILLKKVEELTLHAVNQEEKQNNSQAMIEQLQVQNELLLTVVKELKNEIQDLKIKK
jgi:hypothetical protein